uniref:Uncharacterized protein n=1 Tax=Oryza meridionalis TaxID=40149 RepID=A0A0E0D7N5_9ORYZ
MDYRQQGNHVTLCVLDWLPMFAAGWFPTMSGSGDDVLLGHASNRFLRAIDAVLENGNTT